MYSEAKNKMWKTLYLNEIMNEKKQESPVDVVKEFVIGSSVHGLKYISRKGGTWWERLFWLVSIAVCAAFGGTFVSSVWESFATSPTATSVASTHYPLYKLPFPAITLCTANRVKRAKGMELFKKYFKIKRLNESFESQLWNIMNLISLTEYPFYYRISQFYNDTAHIHHMFDDFNITAFVLEAMPKCEEVFMSCYWSGVGPLNCCDLLELQRSEMGFCYSFNSLTAEIKLKCPAWDEADAELTEEDMKRRHVDKDCILRRNMGSGRTTGFEVLLKKTKYENHMWTGHQDDKGCKVFVHHPSDYPEPQKSFFFPEKNDQIFAVWISASLTISTPAVKTLDVSERQCYFPSEYSLSLFNIYTEKNCYVECRLKHIAEKCSCVPYFFEDLYLEIRTFKPPPKIPGFAISGQLNCSHCLPLCHQTVYSTHSSTIDNYNQQFEAAGYMDVFYEDMTAVKYLKNVAFGRMDLIVAFGGIIGLFLGMSLLSFVEFFYYFIRLLLSCFLYAPLKKSIETIPFSQDRAFTPRKNKKLHVEPLKLYNVSRKY